MSTDSTGIGDVLDASRKLRDSHQRPTADLDGAVRRLEGAIVCLFEANADNADVLESACTHAEAWANHVEDELATFRARAHKEYTSVTAQDAMVEYHAGRLIEAARAQVESARAHWRSTIDLYRYANSAPVVDLVYRVTCKNAHWYSRDVMRARRALVMPTMQVREREEARCNQAADSDPARTIKRWVDALRELIAQANADPIPTCPYDIRRRVLGLERKSLQPE